MPTVKPSSAPSIGSDLGWTEPASLVETPAEGAATLTERERFRMRLRRRPLLLDGAMGTLLYSRGIPARACLDELLLTRTELISAIHLEYLEAGADAIETNTFGANRFRLADYGLEKLAGRLSRRGAQLAREARETAARDILIAGAIGPLGSVSRTPGRPHPGLARAAFREQIEGLLEGGADMFVFETFERLDLLLAAIEEARRACDLPVVAQMTFGEDMTTLDGTPPEDVAAALQTAGVDAVGVNCGYGPLVCLEALNRLGPPTATAARSIVPNAGLPRRVDGAFVYSAGPDYFAEMVPRMLGAGARILGGCCGTTPAHTRAMRQAIDAAAGQTGVRSALARGQPEEADEGPANSSSSGGSAPSVAGTPASAAPRTPQFDPVEAPAGGARPDTGAKARSEGASRASLAELLARGEYVISVEIDPPRSIRLDRTIEAARQLQAAGADLVNVSDSATGRVRMGALPVAFAISQRLGMECLIHLTTRDRNLMALEAELLGAHALGIRNVLALTGDPPRVADLPAATAVWDVDSIGLIGVLGRLNKAEDSVGGSIGSPAGFTIACALDSTAPDPEKEWSRLERKLAAGAQLIMTQPLFSASQVESMLDRARERFGDGGFPVPVLLGVLPLHNARHAEFLHNEVPGITIPAEQRSAMEAAGGKGVEAGLKMAMNLLDQTEGHVAGAYLMPSFGRYELAAELVRRVRARQSARRRLE